MKDQVQGRLFLDVVIRKSAAIFQLLAGKDEPLLVRGNAFTFFKILLIPSGQLASLFQATVKKIKCSLMFLSNLICGL